MELVSSSQGWAGREPHRGWGHPLPLTGYGCRGLSPSVNSIKVSPTRGRVLQELGVLPGHPTSVSFRSAFLRGIPRTTDMTSFILSFPPRQGGDGRMTSAKHTGDQAQRRRETFPRLHSQCRHAEEDPSTGERGSGPMPYTGSPSCLGFKFPLRVTSFKKIHAEACLVAQW